MRWLVGRATPGGGFADLEPSRGLQANARALAALVAAGAAANEVIVATARQLGEALDAAPAPSWREAREIVEALAACEARRRPERAARAGCARSPAPKKPKSGSAHRASSVPDALADDWAFCKESLGDVSRTFSRPIALLPPRLEVAVSLGYLLCRVADTIEDHVAVDPAQRDELFGLFLDAIERGDDPSVFDGGVRARSTGDDAELCSAAR